MRVFYWFWIQIQAYLFQTAASGDQFCIENKKVDEWFQNIGWNIGVNVF